MSVIPFGDPKCGISQRDLVVAEARSWLGTPYHHRASVKGHGVDCGQLIIRAFIDVGLVPPFETGNYNHDWHLHRNEERYLEYVERYLKRIDDVEYPLKDRESSFSRLPGDVLVWRVGRTFSHGGIVTRWPWIIHSSFPDRMVVEVELYNTPMSIRPMRVYSFWGQEE